MMVQYCQQISTEDYEDQHFQLCDGSEVVHLSQRTEDIFVFESSEEVLNTFKEKLSDPLAGTSNKDKVFGIFQQLEDLNLGYTFFDSEEIATNLPKYPCIKRIADSWMNIDNKDIIFTILQNKVVSQFGKTMQTGLLEIYDERSNQTSFIDLRSIRSYQQDYSLDILRIIDKHGRTIEISEKQILLNFV